MATGNIKPKTFAKPVHINSFNNTLIISIKLDMRVIVVSHQKYFFKHNGRYSLVFFTSLIVEVD